MQGARRMIEDRPVDAQDSVFVDCGLKGCDFTMVLAHCRAESGFSDDADVRACFRIPPSRAPERVASV